MPAANLFRVSDPAIMHGFSGLCTSRRRKVVSQMSGLRSTSTDTTWSGGAWPEEGCHCGRVQPCSPCRSTATGLRHPPPGAQARKAPFSSAWASHAATGQEQHHGKSLPSHGQGPDGREQRFPRKQQDQASFPAQPAATPPVGGKRTALCPPSRDGCRPAQDRQAGRRGRSGRDQRRQGLIPSARTDLTSRENRHA